MSSGPPKPVSGPTERIGPDTLTCSHTSCDRLAHHSQKFDHSPLEYPSRSRLRYHHCPRPCVPGASPHVSLTSFPDLFTGGEHCDLPQPLSVASEFEHDGPRNGEKLEGTLDGHPTISADCRSPASDRTYAEIPTTNERIIFSPLLVVPQESSEDIKISRAETPPRLHHSSFLASPPTAASPPTPVAFEATFGKGILCPCDLITVMLLTTEAIAQPLRR